MEYYPETVDVGARTSLLTRVTLQPLRTQTIEEIKGLIIDRHQELYPEHGRIHIRKVQVKVKDEIFKVRNSDVIGYIFTEFAGKMYIYLSKPVERSLERKVHKPDERSSEPKVHKPVEHSSEPKVHTPVEPASDPEVRRKSRKTSSTTQAKVEDSPKVCDAVFPPSTSPKPVEPSSEPKVHKPVEPASDPEVRRKSRKTSSAPQVKVEDSPKTFDSSVSPSNSPKPVEPSSEPKVHKPVEPASDPEVRRKSRKTSFAPQVKVEDSPKISDTVFPPSASPKPVEPSSESKVRKPLEPASDPKVRSKSRNTSSTPQVKVEDNPKICDTILSPSTSPKPVELSSEPKVRKPVEPASDPKVQRKSRKKSSTPQVKVEDSPKTCDPSFPASTSPTTVEPSSEPKVRKPVEPASDRKSRRKSRKTSSTPQVKVEDSPKICDTFVPPSTSPKTVPASSSLAEHCMPSPSEERSVHEYVVERAGNREKQVKEFWTFWETVKKRKSTMAKLGALPDSRPKFRRSHS